MNKVLLHTPDGVRDIYGSECSDRLIVRDKIHEKMKLYGYEDIETPTFEFFDVFAQEINASDARELYKFFEKDGNTMVLRPDFTPSIARCASKVMLENPIPHPARKTEHHPMEYDVDIKADMSDYDIKISDDDDFDI